MRLFHFFQKSDFSMNQKCYNVFLILEMFFRGKTEPPMLNQGCYFTLLELLAHRQIEHVPSGARATSSDSEQGLLLGFSILKDFFAEVYFSDQ